MLYEVITLGLGAQFGGKHFCLDIRIIRLPRHGASCPIGMGVSCSADRNIKAKITKDGIFLEKMETSPARYLPEVATGVITSYSIHYTKLYDDPESTENDKFVARELLKNAVIAAEMEFPMCQDTGTAIIMGKKGKHVWADFNEEEALSKGVFNAYTQTALRYSQNAPLTMYEEKIV